MLMKISVIFVSISVCCCVNNKTKIFKLPSGSIELVKDDSLRGNLQNFVSQNTYKCLIFLDGNCGVCLSNLYSVEKFIESCHIPYVFVVQTKSKKTFKAYCDQFGIDIGPVAFEPIDRLQQMNKLPDVNFLLLNGKNEIISTKNPLIDKENQKVYKQVKKLNLPSSSQITTGLYE